MVSKKKYVMPKMDLEGESPEVVQLVALVAALTDRTNAAREQIAAPLFHLGSVALLVFI